MILLIFICSVSVLITIAYFIFQNDSKRSFKSFHDIPCPGAIPLLGNICDIFYSDAEIWKITRARAVECYPIYRLKMFNTNVVCLLHPEDIELVLGSTVHTEKNYMYDTMKKLTGNGLLVNKGESWKGRRRLLTKNFHFATLHNYIEIFNREVQSLVNRLNEKINQPIDILDPITDAALKIINEVIVGKELKLDETEIKDYVSALLTFTEIIGYKSSKPYINLVYNFSKLKDVEERSLRVMQGFSSKVVKNTGQQLREDDTPRVLDVMINAPNLYDEQGIMNEIDTFIFGGNSTTSAGLLFALLVLANHPEYQEEVYQEIVQTVGLDDDPSYADLKNMSFLDRFLKESLRLYPPAPFIGRILKKDLITKTGYKIPAGTSVMFHIFDIHRNPDIFVNPQVFDPDRFLPENVRKRHPYSYLPFSAGPRNCIAQKFAVLEIKASICGILKNFKLEAVDSIHDVVFVPDASLRTLESVKVKLINRSK